MAVGSHLHEHAESIRLEDVTDDVLLWEGYPVENEEGELQTVTVGELYWTLGEPLDPSHEYRATVVYDNPTTDTIPGGGMGVVAGAFLPDAETWPEADTTNRLYRLDRRHYLRRTHGPVRLEHADSLLALTADRSCRHLRSMMLIEFSFKARTVRSSWRQPAFLRSGASTPAEAGYYERFATIGSVDQRP